MSVTKIEADSAAESDCKPELSDDSAVDSIFEEWEERKAALLAPDETIDIIKYELHGREKPNGRKPKNSSSNENSEDVSSVKQPRLCRTTVNNAIRMLSREKPKLSTAESRMQKYCRGELSYSTSFDSPTNILAAIRWCVLTRNWRRMVDLLLIFVRTNKNAMYNKYIREVGVDLFVWCFLHAVVFVLYNATLFVCISTFNCLHCSVGYRPITCQSCKFFCTIVTLLKKTETFTG